MIKQTKFKHKKTGEIVYQIPVCNIGDYEKITEFKSKLLNCGCCGNLFKTWDTYQDQDQDDGYGICESCQKEAGKKVTGL